MRGQPLQVIQGAVQGGYMPRPETKPMELRAKAIELYISGLSLRQVASSIGVFNTTVQRWLKIAGIELRNKSTAMMLRNPPRSNHWRSSRQSSRRLMERHLGRKLDFNEVVHHKDEDYTNRDLENLEVMPRSEHGRLHMLGNTYTPRKSECINGHKLEGDNVREFFRRDRNCIERSCRACARERMKKQRAK